MTLFSTPVPSSFARYVCSVQYIGTKYNGWSNSNKLPSVAGRLMLALNEFAGVGNALNFKGSSRTDRGVHAIQNIFQVDIRRRNKNTFETKESSSQMNNEHVSSSNDCNIYSPDTVRAAMNYHLGKGSDDIFIMDVIKKTDNFDVRYDATGRTYVYRIISNSRNHSDNKSYNAESLHAETARGGLLNVEGTSNRTITPSSSRRCNPLVDKRMWLFHKERAWLVPHVLDVEAMRLAAAHLVGEHDFASFRGPNCQSSITYREVFYIDIDRVRVTGSDDPFSRDVLLCFAPTEVITITISASAFLQRMVRNIVGALVDIGMGRFGFSPADMKRLLDLKERGRVPCQCAPSEGLYLRDVHYDKGRLTAYQRSLITKGLSHLI